MYDFYMSSRKFNMWNEDKMKKKNQKQRRAIEKERRKIPEKINTREIQECVGVNTEANWVNEPSSTQHLL